MTEIRTETSHLKDIVTTMESGAMPDYAPEGGEEMRPDAAPVIDNTVDDSDDKPEPPTAEPDAPKTEADESKTEADESKTEAEPEAGETKGEKPKPKVQVRRVGEDDFEIIEGEKKTIVSKEAAEWIARKRVGKVLEKSRALDAELAQERETRLRLERDEARMRAELAELRGKAPEGDPDKPWTKQGADKPKLEDFDDVEAWADARDEWKTAQEAKPEPKTEPETEEAEAQPDKAWVDGIRQFNTEAMKAHGDDYKEFVLDNDEAPFDKLFVDVVRNIADDPAAVLIELGKDIEQAHNIHRLMAQGNGPQVVKQLARLELALSNGGNAAPSGNDAAVSDDFSSAETPTKAVIRPPKPAGSPRRSPASLAEKSTEDYFAWRKDQHW